MHTYLQSHAHKSEFCSINSIKCVFNTQFEISNVLRLTIVSFFQFSIQTQCFDIRAAQCIVVVLVVSSIIDYVSKNFMNNCPYFRSEVIMRHNVYNSANHISMVKYSETLTTLGTEKTLREEMRAFKNYRPSHYYYHKIDSNS